LAFTFLNTVWPDSFSRGTPELERGWRARQKFEEDAHDRAD
jgi:hypothetical protein